MSSDDIDDDLDEDADKDMGKDVEAALRVLSRIAEDRAAMSHVDRETREKLQRLCGEIARPDLKQRKKLQKALMKREREEKRAHDEALRDSAEIRAMRKAPVFVTPAPKLVYPRDLTPAMLGAGEGPPTEPAPPPEPAPPEAAAAAARPADGARTFRDARKCYVCKREYRELHSFYDQLCAECGDLNLRKRTATVDLRGRTALITGARVKIGYQAAILMLRAGCTVVAVTRFPRDAAARYAKEPDFADWQDRLLIYGVDLRHTPSVDHFTKHLLDTLPRLDFQIHNACQTVRRPPGFYAHLVENEHAPLSAVPAAQRQLVERDHSFRESARAPSPALLSQAKSDADRLLPSDDAADIFPKGALDQDLQQVDLRQHNSWRLTLGEVPTLELLEVLLVNAAAPFVMASKLKPLMQKSTPAPHGTATSSDDARHIVMVSAMEGQFYRGHKTDKHPHTNAAKAALNMTVRTSAVDYARDRIFMNAVDTGWVTDEDPAHIAAMKAEEHRFSPPLDIVDGAARIVDPIIDGFLTGKHRYGLFLKDYTAVPW